MTTPAGWYDDGSGRQRWWDGVAWTEHTVTAQTPPATAQHSTAGDGPAVESAAVESATFEPPYVLQTASSTDAHPGLAADATAWGQAPMYGQQGTAHPAQGAAGLWGAAAPAPAKPKLSVLGIIGLGVAVIGLVLSCFPSIAIAGWVLLGIGFIVSLVSVFLRGAKWPGIVGLAVSVLGAIVAIAVMLLSFSPSAPGATVPTPSAGSSSPDDDERDGSATDGAERVYINDLEVGHCLPLVEWEDEVYDLPVVPCDQPHTDEVYFIFDAPDGDFPGDAELQTLATERCDAAFEEFIGIPYADSELDNYWFVPTETSWKRANDRAIQCIVFSYEDVTGTLEGAAR